MLIISNNKCQLLETQATINITVDVKGVNKDCDQLWEKANMGPPSILLQVLLEQPLHRLTFDTLRTGHKAVCAFYVIQSYTHASVRI